ncbi:MAG: VanZ family protein [Lachnospiraceae bacterium]|nr:VanZ family protein [Lachnospiraceae bacterium]
MNIPKSKNNRVWKICFFLYLILIIRFIIFKYPMEQLLEIAKGWKKEVILEGLNTANFTLGKSIKMYIRYFHRFPFWNGMANLFGNFFAFIPLGILFPLCYDIKHIKRVTFLFSFLFIISIEMFQLFSAFGVFDVDDILLNVLGSMIGGLLYEAAIRKEK